MRLHLIFLLSILFFGFPAHAVRTRVAAHQSNVQPSSWWAGMKWSTVDFLVFHEGGINSVKLSKSSIAVGKEISVRKINNYYSIVKVKVLKAGNLIFEGKNKQGREFKLSAIIYPKNNYQPKGFDKSDLIYLIMPDRFANGNESNDEVPNMEGIDRNAPGGRHGGDLQGIMDHLFYIKNLGVTALWLTPFQEMNDEQYSYHGYGTSNYYAADPRYTAGSLNPEENLDICRQYSQVAHKEGLKLIIDAVPNHIGNVHPWKKYLREWIHDSVICNFEMVTQTDPYAVNEDKDRFEKGWFVPSMPDLNHQNPDVVTYLTQCYIWWIKTMDFDGIRIDTQPFNDKDMMKKWVSSIRSEFPKISFVGENWCVINNTIWPAYYQSNTRNPDKYDSKVQYVMNFPGFEAMVNGLKNNDALQIYRTIAQDIMYEYPERKVNFLGNHDTERFFTSIGEDQKKYELGILLLAMMNGIPQLYYGDEILMTGPKGINDGIMRKDMPGGWLGDRENVFTTQPSSYTFTSQVFNYRKSHPVMATGRFTHLTPKNNIYAMRKANDQEGIIVIFNFNNEEKALDKKYLEPLLNGYKIKKQFTFTSGSQDIISAKGAMILELTK